jgi:Fe-S cluster assembly iron-binding protein IscA
MLTLTESAAAVIHELTSQPGMPADTGLRIAPSSANSDGPAFAVSLSEGPSPQDEVVETREARVFLEPEIAGQLADKVLDALVDDTGGIAFQVSPRT